MLKLQGFIDRYLNHLQTRMYALNTTLNYEINLRYFWSFCKAFEVNFEEMKGSNMIHYIDSMIAYKPATINLRLSVLRSFYEYLIAVDLMIYNPVRQSHFIRINRKKPNSLTEEEEQLFVRFINEKDDHVRLAFLLLLNTGIRISEMKKLKIENFIKINNKYYLEVLESKNDSDRIVPLSEDIYNLIQEYGRTKLYFGPVFTMTTRAYQYYADYFSDFYDIRFSVHSLRHTYATRRSQEGLPVQIIQKLLGHKDINTTMYYVEVTNQDILNL